MRAYVFTDKSLERYAGRFVWLSVDTENAASAPFLKKFPINVWPTLLVIEPATESVALRYSGGATTPQLKRLLDDGENVVRGKARDAAGALLSSADKLESAGRHADAAKVYEQAIAKAPKGWKSFGRAAEALVFTLSMSGNSSQCAITARNLYPRVKGTTSAANVAGVGLDCAASLEKTDTKRAELLPFLEKVAREVLDDKELSISADDRSGLYGSLIDAREVQDDTEGMRRLREEWATFLEGAADRAKTPEQRTVYDAHRLTVYLALGKPEKAVPMLEQSERDFPQDYNPPSRLAAAYRAMKKYDEALAASDRALARVYGPRKITVLQRRFEIYLDRGDKEAARRTLEDAVRYAKSLPEGQRSDSTIASLEKKLTEM